MSYIHPLLRRPAEEVSTLMRRYWIGIRPGKMVDGTEVECPFDNIDIKVTFRKREPTLIPTKEQPHTLQLIDVYQRGTHVDLSDADREFILRRAGEKVLRLLPLKDDNGKVKLDEVGRPIVRGYLLNVLLGWEWDEAKKRPDYTKEIPNPGYTRDARYDVPLGCFLYMCDVTKLPPAYRETYDPPPLIDDFPGKAHDHPRAAKQS